MNAGTMSVTLIHFRPLPALNCLTIEEAEIIPGKHSDTRIKPLPLTDGHGRYMTVTPEGVRGEGGAREKRGCLRIREALQEANRNKANSKFKKFKFKI
jgi:hypothetical protein